MPKSAKIYRTFLGLAAVTLASTAVLHAIPFSAVSGMVDRSNLPAEWAPAMKGLWLMFSIHLVILAALLVVLAFVPASRAVLAVAASMPVADTILLFVAVGVFIGSIMTGVAAALVLAALAAQPPSASVERGVQPAASRA